MATQIFTVILVLIFIWMIIRCGTGVMKSGAGCCGGHNMKSDDHEQLKNRLDSIEEENEQLKRDIDRYKQKLE